MDETTRQNRTGMVLFQMFTTTAWARDIAPLTVNTRPLFRFQFRTRTPQADALIVANHLPMPSRWTA